jgi:hypothetical protein
MLEHLFAKKNLDFAIGKTKFRAQELTGDDMLNIARDPTNTNAIANDVLQLQHAVLVFDGGQYRKMSLDGEVLKLPKHILEMLKDRFSEVESQTRDAQTMLALTHAILLLPKTAPEQLFKLLGDEIQKIQQRNGADGEGESPLAEPRKHDDYDT